MAEYLSHPVGDTQNGALVQVSRLPEVPAFRGFPVYADYLWNLAEKGKIFVASDADQNDVVTGQTSFADTTPTFLLDIPAKTTVLPLYLNLSQAGTVAGDVVSFVVEIDNKTRWASGGTAEKVFNTQANANPNRKSTFYSNPTTSAGYGIRIDGKSVGQDVSPAEGAVPPIGWRPEIPYLLTGPASILFFTYAGTTGPSWYWSFAWAELGAGD